MKYIPAAFAIAIGIAVILGVLFIIGTVLFIFGYILFSFFGVV